MHFEGKLPDTVLARKLGSFLPVGNDSFLPLPVENLGVFGWPAVRGPVRHGVGGVAGGTSREADNHFHAQALGEKHRAAERFGVALGDFRVRMNGVAVATERRYSNIFVFELLFPGAHLGRIVQQFLHRTMLVAGIASGSDLDGLDSPCRELLDHHVGREIRESRIENADRNLARDSRRKRRFLHSLGARRGERGNRYRRRKRAAGTREKFSATDRAGQ